MIKAFRSKWTFDSSSSWSVLFSSSCQSELSSSSMSLTKFLLERGARVSAKLSSTNYRRSPLVQGRLEIPCIVTVSMPGTIINQLLMEKYKQLVETLYAEPNEEKILGSFLTPDNSNDIWTGPSPVKKKKKEKEISKARDLNQKDIRKFLNLRQWCQL